MSSIASDLTQVLTDARGELPVLRKHGQHAIADAMEALIAQVDAATESFRRFIPEADASLRSGRSVRWWRQQYAALEREGHARTERGQRLYRLLIVPTRARTSDARSRGRDAARSGAA